MDTIDSCPICNMKLKSFENVGRTHSFYVGCKRCGEYELTEQALHSIEGYTHNDTKKRILISYGIRQLQKNTDRPVVNIHIIEKLLEGKLPTFQEQVKNFLDLLRQNVNAPGEQFRVEGDSQISIVGSPSIQAYEALIKHLVNSGKIEALLSKAIGNHVNGYVSFTGDGWLEYEAQLENKNLLVPAFMAMDFKNPHVEIIFKDVYKPLCLEFRFDLNIVDKKAGIIDVRIREQIKESKLLIADLSDDNNGAYWEAGIAEGREIPVIYSCERKKFAELKTHFDTNHLTTAMWSVDDFEFSAAQLKEIMIATFKDEES